MNKPKDETKDDYKQIIKGIEDGISDIDNIYETKEKDIEYYLIHLESYEENIILTGVEAFEEVPKDIEITYQDKDNETKIFNSFEYSDNLNGLNVKNSRYINILIKHLGKPFFNFSNEPPVILNINSINNGIYIEEIKKYFIIYREKICMYSSIIKQDYKQEHPEMQDCNLDYNLFIKEFIELINSTLNIPFIYKLNTLKKDPAIK